MTNEILEGAGFVNKGSEDFPNWQSLDSERCGPVTHLRYSPYLGCDGWEIGSGYYVQFAGPENSEELLCLMKGLGIPTTLTKETP